MDVVRTILVPAKLLREGDYVPYGGWIQYIVRHGTKGLFPKRYVTVTFYTGDDYLDYTMEDHLPVEVERIYDQVSNIKEKK